MKTQRAYIPQFSLRSVVVAVSIAAVLLGPVFYNARDHARRLAVVRQHGTVYSWSHEHDPSGGRIPDATVPGPKWLRFFLGDEFFTTPLGISIDRPIGDDDFACLSHFTELRELIVEPHASITDEGLMASHGLTKLEMLSMPHVKIKGEGLRYLTGMRKLKDLFLGNSTVTDTGLPYLDGLKELTNVDLSDTNVTDAGLQYLGRVESLYDLELNNTQVTDEGLKHLVKLSNTKQIGIRGTLVSDEGAAGLREALPDCRVVHTGSDKVNQVLKKLIGW